MSHVQTRAFPEGEEWVLRGVKTGVLHGESADCFLISARIAGEVEDEGGISLFLVPATAPGVMVRGVPAIDGGRSAEVRLKDVRIPGEALVGEHGGGIATIEHAIGAGVLGLCAEALGAMEEAKAATLAYLRTRKQFGQPLGTFQALQHRMATLLLEVEQARSSVINAASALAADRVRRERALSAARGRTQAIQRIARSHAGTSAMKEMANSPLSGIKVLDLSRVLAGPLVGTLLAYARWGMPFSDQMHQVAEVGLPVHSMQKVTI